MIRRTSPVLASPVERPVSARVASNMLSGMLSGMFSGTLVETFCGISIPRAGDALSWQENRCPRNRLAHFLRIDPIVNRNL